MNTVTITDSAFIVEPQGPNKLWSFTRRLELPLAHVQGATIDPGANNEPRGIRAPGVALPGKWAGTFHREGERAFWNVSTPGEPIVIELTDEHDTRLVLTVDNLHERVDAINTAVQA